MKTTTTAADYLRAAEYHQKRARDYTEDAYNARQRITPNMKPGPASAHLVAVIDSATSASDRADRAAESAKEVEDRGGTPDQIRAASTQATAARDHALHAGVIARAATAATFPVF